MAHGHIAVVSSEEDLVTLGDDPPACIDAGIDRRFPSAGANGLDLGQGIGQLHQALRTGKKVGQKVGPETEAENRQILFVHQRAQIVDLPWGEKLRFIRNDDIVPASEMISLYDALFRRNDLGAGFQPDPAADQIRSVPGIDARFNEPYRHAEFLVVELRNQGLGGFGGTHRAVFKI